MLVRLLFPIPKYRPSPLTLTPARQSVSFPDSPAYPDALVRTNERLIPNEVISRIEEITAIYGDGAKLADHLHEDAAQSFVDAVYEVHPHFLSLPACSVSFPCPLLSPFNFLNFAIQALDRPVLPSPLRSKWFTALYRVCGRRALLPRSLQIPLCYDRLELPQYSGGFADVWMGDHQGRRVAAKALRVYLTSDLTEIRRVCLFKPESRPTDGDRAEVLQGSDQVEIPQPSKHITTPGSDGGQGTICDGVRLDGKWEHHRVHWVPSRRRST